MQYEGEKAEIINGSIVLATAKEKKKTSEMTKMKTS